MRNREIEEKKTKQIVIDIGYHQMIRILAAKRSMTIKTLVEGLIADEVAKENMQ